MLFKELLHGVLPQLKVDQVLLTAQIKRKSHRRVQSAKRYFLRLLFMERSMPLLEYFLIKIDGLLARMWLKKD